MLNRVILIGRLTKDVELRYTPSGVAVATYTLAVDRQVKQGEEKQADFIPIVSWRQTAEACANYLRKGRLCAVEGRMQVRNYEKDGRKVYVTEVHTDNVRFLEKGEGGQDLHRSSQEERPSRNNARNDTEPFADDGKPIDISDDDLPF